MSTRADLGLVIHFFARVGSAAAIEMVSFQMRSLTELRKSFPALILPLVVVTDRDRHSGGL